MREISFFLSLYVFVSMPLGRHVIFLDGSLSSAVYALFLSFSYGEAGVTVQFGS
jgi:hypothetical protein